MRKNLFNNGWSFILIKDEKLKTLPTFDDARILPLEIRDELTKWNPVEVPHDWLIYDTLNLYQDGIGFYRKEWNILPEDKEKRFFLRFDGIYMDSTIYINGHRAFEWKYGYSAFEFEISEWIIENLNEIIVCIRHFSPNSRWYSGAGIYRDVWLKTCGKLRIMTDGIYINCQKVNDSGWTVNLDTELEVRSDKEFLLRHTITGPDGNVLSTYLSPPLLSSRFESKSVYQTYKVKLAINSPEIWDINSPNLHILKTELLEGNTPVDEVINRFGFRTTEFNPDKGFILNGRRLKLFGVCQHHDLGCLGAATNKAAIRRQFNILKEMGVNAVRTAHNMPAEVFMDLADEMGLLIVSEAFDMWERPKTKYDYARFFNSWGPKDLESWIRRDRNRPSVIIWSIGNEISDTNIEEDGYDIAEFLYSLVRLYDYHENARTTIASNYLPWENAQKCTDMLKLAGYNYGAELYHEHHEKYPGWIIYGSETGSIVQSRGIYHFPLNRPLLSDDDEQCSSLGNSTTSWGAKSIEHCLISDRDALFSAGQFIWSGFDYIGEPTPYHTKNSYFGQIDTAGFKKDSFYIFKSHWTDYKTDPMVHIFPYWDFSPGQMIDVRVCSNAPKVELFFNEKSLGCFDIDHKNGQKLIADWHIPYETGRLLAVAYDEEGKIIAEDIKESFGDAYQLSLSPDKIQVYADGHDLIFVEIAVLDKKGVRVENANNRIFVKVSGAGRLMGLDNGDSTDYEQYKTTSRRLFSGKLLAVIAGEASPGEISLSVTSKGLKPCKLDLTSLPVNIPEGVSEPQLNTAVKKPKFPYAKDEIPIRKIELISEAGLSLSSDLPEVTVKALIYPAKATYNDLEFRISDGWGVDSNIALARTDSLTNSVTVKALSNGEFYLRCMTKNGSRKTRLISQLGFTVSGMGEAFLNPYKFVAGMLYNASNIELSNGNERGVATDRILESHVGFKNVDFGNYGSDEVTIPVFAFSDEPFPIEFWEGMPGEKGSELLLNDTYTKGSQWNTYLEQTFKLKRRLKGVTCFCITVSQKIHLKGFTFTKMKKHTKKQKQ